MNTLSKLISLAVVGVCGVAMGFAQGAPAIDYVDCCRTLTGNLRSCSIVVPEPGGVLDKARKPSGDGNGWTSFLPVPKNGNGLQGYETGYDCHQNAFSGYNDCIGAGPVIIEKKTGTTKGVVNTPVVTKKKED